MVPRIETAAPAARRRCRDSHLPASDATHTVRPGAPATPGEVTTIVLPSIFAAASTKFLSVPASWNHSEVSAPGHQPSSNVRELDADRVTFNLHRFVHWARVFDLLAVHLGASDPGQAVTQVLFVPGMHVGLLADIHGHGHRRVGDLQRLSLCFADLGAVAAGVLRGQLHEIEGEFPLPPLLSPARDHVLHDDRIERQALGDRFTLIPEDASDGVRLDRLDHRIPQNIGVVLVGKGIRRAATPAAADLARRRGRGAEQGPSLAAFRS